MNEQAGAAVTLYPTLIVLLPLLGFLINGLGGKKIASEKISGIVGSGVIGLSFMLALFVFWGLLGRPAEERSYTVTLFEWIAAGGLSVNAAFQIDQLSVLMMLIVTGVGFLIHVYSIGYMHGDPAFWRFFAYLNLFIFMMLTLVMADNFLLMFLGWEGVGLCSYLLIGFWHTRKFDTGGYPRGGATTSDAAKKAFVVNRIGDAGFLIAMFMIFTATGTLNFGTLFTQAPARFTSGEPLIVAITLLLFLGATGKSAQIPLYIWLPDAMAGPTPVSALIHAATMVTAGVYMVARCSVLFVLAPVTMETVAVVGIATAFFAATMGLVQTDIKKILAYSTVSQLGYMFAGLGVGAFTAGLFHVMTHAFFKALLFLGAGAVIHALHDEQDVTKMGGLKKFMPGTYRTQLVAALAIAGVPPLAGFFSKDEILWKAFSQGSVAIWFLGWLTAGLTAFYMFRMLTLVFEGEPRFGHDRHPHEAPATMLAPLVILAFLSVTGGFLGVPHALGGGNALESWLEPVFERSTRILSAPGHGALATEYLLMALSVGIGLAGILLARRLFIARLDTVNRIAARFASLHTLLFNKYYVDEACDAIVVNPLKVGSQKLLWKGIDVGIIDGAVNGMRTPSGRAVRRREEDPDGQCLELRAGRADRHLAASRLHHREVERMTPESLLIAADIPPDRRFGGDPDARQVFRRDGQGSGAGLFPGRVRRLPRGRLRVRPRDPGLPDGEPDPVGGHPLDFIPRRDRRHVAPADPAHDVHDADRAPRFVEFDREKGEGIRRDDAPPGGRHPRRVRRARHLPLLHLLGGDAHPDVFHHRDLGGIEPGLRRGQVLPLHDDGQPADARRDHLAGVLADRSRSGRDSPPTW